MDVESGRGFGPGRCLPEEVMVVTNRREAARRKLLNILSRADLEFLSLADRPHMKTHGELINLAVKNWDLQEVHDCVERIFRRADPEGTQP